jgi:hypothetical protein
MVSQVAGDAQIRSRKRDVLYGPKNIRSSQVRPRARGVLGVIGKTADGQPGSCKQDIARWRAGILKEVLVSLSKKVIGTYPVSF